MVDLDQVQRLKRPSMTIDLHFVEPWTLSPRDIDEIAAFVSRYLRFERSWLEAWIERCTRVITYRERSSGRLVGTTAIDVVDMCHQGRDVRVLYTRAVILDTQVRQRGLIQRAGMATYLHFGLVSRRRAYWFCECDSISGYRVAALSFDAAWPCARSSTPPFERALSESLCEALFGDD